MSICFAFYAPQPNLSCSAPPRNSSARNPDVNMNAAQAWPCLRERGEGGGTATAVSLVRNIGSCGRGSCLSSSGFSLSLKRWAAQRDATFNAKTSASFAGWRGRKAEAFQSS